MRVRRMSSEPTRAVKLEHHHRQPSLDTARPQRLAMARPLQAMELQFQHTARSQHLRTDSRPLRTRMRSASSLGR
jgi:hypothetical protein